MHRTLEVVFRQPLRLLMLIVLLPVVSLALAYLVVPPTYQSTATLWALSSYGISGTTNVGTGQPTTAAQTQTTALSELLQTRSFALAVAHETDVAATLNLDQRVRSDPHLLDDALFDEISHNVAVEALGSDLFEVSYANRDPQMARRVVETIVFNYGLQSTGLITLVNQSLLRNYQKQLIIAQQNANAAVAAESAYLAAHPKLTQNPNLTPSQLLTDPNYALLDQQRVQAQATLGNIESSIGSLNQTISNQGTSTDSLFKVIDAPQVAHRPVSRLRLYLIVGGVGLAVAMLGCAFYIVISARRDHGVYTVRDLQKVTALPVVMQLPHLTSATVPLLIEESVYADTTLGRRGTDRANDQLW